MTGTTALRAAGMPEANIKRFMQTIRRYGITMHSVLIQQSGELCYERYWAPFTADTPHRMYSVTKSFVAMAIGCLLDEGKISLDDPITDYFPDKLPAGLSPLMKQQTIREMLTMTTCLLGPNWFKPGVVDRTAFYFAQKPDRPSGTLFSYDSTGSYILGALVERLSGRPLLDYMKEKFLNRIGGFENAQMLTVPDGVAWGDSALICTPRAMLNFARLLMDGGRWEGEQLISEDYVCAATSLQTTNDLDCNINRSRWGYGYQIWMGEQDSFSFHGMGGQFAICVPKKDFIFVCTGDNQFNDSANETIFRAVFDHLIPDEPDDSETVFELPVVRGAAQSAFAPEIAGRTFSCEENPMGIKWFRLEFSEGEGCFVYENAQGEKRLPFGMGRNWFGKFPQFGYSDGRGNVHDETSDFRYDCAVSGGWLEPRKLQIRVQIIDRYFGSLIITFGFRDADVVAVNMAKVAEDFLTEYSGRLVGSADSQ